MLSDAVRYVPAVVDLLGDSDLTDDEIEQKVVRLTGDEMLARRLIDWIPEVFGYVLIGHLGRFTLDATFQAKSASGEWKSFDISSEPIVAAAGKMAVAMFHDGPRDDFQRISGRNSTLDAVNNALNANPNASGTLSGPAFVGIPASVYAKRGA